ILLLFFFSSRRRHTRSKRDWSSDVCSSDLDGVVTIPGDLRVLTGHARVWDAQVDGLPAPDEVATFDQVVAAIAAVPQGEGDGQRSEERRVGKGGGCGWAEGRGEQEVECREG